MNIFSKRDKNGRFEANKDSDKSSSEESKTASAPSKLISDDDSPQSKQSQQNDSKVEDTSPSTVKGEPSKMDNARLVFQEMFGKDGVQRKDIILAFQSNRVNLTPAGSGTYYAKLKREHLDNIGDIK